MKTSALVFLMLVIGSLYTTADAEDVAGTQPGAGPRNGSSQSAAVNNPDARFAQILAQLTTDRLERAKHANAEVPGTVASDDIALIQQELEAFVRLQNDAKDGGKINWFNMLIDMAEATKSSADSDWQRVSAIRAKNPQSLSELDADMMRLRAELADVNLQRGKAVASGSADERQNWALQYLFVQMQEVRDRVRVLEERE
jgi:hypothetical protein